MAETTRTGINDSTIPVFSDATNIAGKKILLNAFDMSTAGYLSPGQWRNPKDRSSIKRKLDCWIHLAELFDQGGINALFLADTCGRYDAYEGSLDNCIRRAAQRPITDPSIVCASLHHPTLSAKQKRKNP